jgi:hypothetical protein
LVQLAAGRRPGKPKAKASAKVSQKVLKAAA